MSEMEKIQDPFETLKAEGFEPEIMEDNDDFPKLKGCYKAHILDVVHKTGTSTAGKDYDFYGIKVVVDETVNGDRGDNRYLDTTFQNTPEGIKMLSSALFTIGVETDRSNQDAFDESLVGAIGKPCNIRCWVWKNKETGQEYQKVKIVKDFKLKKTAAKSTTPF